MRKVGSRRVAVLVDESAEPVAPVSAKEAMTLGPSTVRPSLELETAVERMRAQNLTTLPVTRSDGVLIGVLRREDAEQALESLARA